MTTYILWVIFEKRPILKDGFNEAHHMQLMQKKLRSKGTCRSLIHILFPTKIGVIRLDYYAKFNFSASINEFKKVSDVLVPSYRHFIKLE